MPGGSRATLVYQGGRIKREDKPSFAEYTARSRIGLFVRVDVLPSSDQVEEAQAHNEAGNEEVVRVIDQWMGVIVHEQLAVGVGDSGDAPQDQIFTCAGLEHVLATTMIDGSFSADQNGDVLPKFATVLAFNERVQWGQSLIGNRIATAVEIRQDVECFVFDGATTAVPWSVHDAVDYLLKSFGPEAIEFQLSGQASELTKLKLPRTDVAGLSLLEALNQLIDIRRGFGWCIRVPYTAPTEDGADPEPIKPKIHVFSIAEVDITLADATLVKNAEAADLNIAGRIDVIDSRFTFDARSSYGSIEVAGERVLVMGCFSIADGTLVKGWNSDQETKYNNSSGSTVEFRDAQRQLDGLSNVYSLFRVPSTWDFKTGTGQGDTSAKANANPAVKDDGYIDTDNQAPIRGVWGLTFERYLPLFKAPLASVNARADLREPVVFLQDETTGKWLSADTVPVHVRMSDHELAVQVRAHPNHLLAKGTADSIQTNTQPVYDYRKAIVTAAFRTDQPFRIVTSVAMSPWAGETEEQFEARRLDQAKRRLVIRVPDAEYVHAVPGTPIEVTGAIDGLTAGELVRHAGGQIRNDVDVLRRVSNSARAWFGGPRSGFSLVRRGIYPDPKAGGLVKSVKESTGDKIVNAVITSITVDLEQQTTSLQTSFIELDFGQRN